METVANNKSFTGMWLFSYPDACDSGWRHTRDGLSIAGFVASVLILILAVIILLIFVRAREQHIKQVVSTYSHIKWNSCV